MITGIEAKIIGEDKGKLLYEKILDMFQELRVVCEGLHEECEVLKEIDKQAPLNAKYNQVSSVDDSTKLVQEYADYIGERQASLSSVHQKHKSKLSKERKAAMASVDQQINKFLGEFHC